ncbi:hypothetical protein DH86_00001181 [Scytalidium sp. 3C]|nr:hypothetical protein DH86_00001181 [Scytalidium sp. 3C]
MPLVVDRPKRSSRMIDLSIAELASPTWTSQHHQKHLEELSGRGLSTSLPVFSWLKLQLAF